MNKKQLKSMMLMFLIISVMYSVTLINQEGVESLMQDSSKGIIHFFNFIKNPRITGFATIFDIGPPYFDPSPPDYDLTQDQLFEVQINATDPDNDTITFTDNSNSPEVNWPVFEITNK